MGTGGSGMPTMPPTGSGSGTGGPGSGSGTGGPGSGSGTGGSGSGSGATPLPPTGGNGTGVTITVEVFNALTNTPLSGAYVQVDFGMQYSGRTDQRGSVSF